MATNTPLQSISLISASSSVTFSNIDQTYTDLVIIMNSGSINNDDVDLTFNGDTNANYSRTMLLANGSTASSTRESNDTVLQLTYQGNPSAQFSWISNVHINNYSNATTYKTALCKTVNADTYGIDYQAGLWRSAAAITSVKLASRYSSFAAGSTFDLYGIKSGAPKAFGGDTVTTDGNYWYHTFKTSGTFTPQYPISVDYLVVAGGGGGGTQHGGGGGAGGLRSTVTATGGGGSLETALSMAPGLYTVTIGGGGSGNASYSAGAPTTSPTSGSNSVFSTITSTGGGRGGSYSLNAGAIGGSGGGGGYYYNPTGAAGTANQGYAGGNGSVSPGAGNLFGGGGGGAGANGSNGSSSNVGGNGGNGVAVSISGSSVTYAGGGGGGGDTTSGTGGTGGGGNGTTNGVGVAGTANSGGGGGANGGSDANGGNGGSGIVILRYAV